MIDARTSRRHVEEIRSLARPLVSPGDLDPLVERIGDARLVLVGEASHGTAEFYRWRAELTRRLVAEEGFDLVAVEGDWPDCARLDRWVKSDADTGSFDALQNAEVIAGAERYYRAMIQGGS